MFSVDPYACAVGRRWCIIRAMAIAKKLKDTLLSLTWEGLCNWAGRRSVERGKGYLSRVAALSVFPDGGIVAEVHGHVRRSARCVR